MSEKVSLSNLKSETNKNFKKSNLDLLTEENDHLRKSLKRPSGSYKAA